MLAADDSQEALGRDECRRLLGTSGTGRVGFTARALPAVQPVHFGVREHRLVFPAAPSGRLATACRGAVVVVQADGHSDGTAWTVEVVGVADVVTDPVEVADLDRLVPTRGTLPGHCYIAVEMGLISGWRVTPPASHPVETCADDGRAIA